MSRITNEPKIRNKLIAAIREQLEHRAFWLYLLCDEAGKRGLAGLWLGCRQKMRIIPGKRTGPQRPDKKSERSEKNVVYKTCTMGV